ncbi:cytochrome bd oxidase small subunit CydS [Planococcus plakortidis]
MQDFLIFYAPFLVLGTSIAMAFLLALIDVPVRK